MAKRKKAARIAEGSASGFLTSPLLQQTQGVGGQALSTIASALGLGGMAGGGAGAAGGGAGGFNADAYLAANPDVAQAYSAFKTGTGGWDKWAGKWGVSPATVTPQQFAQLHYGQWGQSENRPLGDTGAAGGAGAGAAGGGATSGQSALEQFMNSLGFQSQLRAGQQAVTGSRAAAGKLGSGATLKALTRYGQDLAQQGFQSYLNQLGGLAGAGQSAASQQAAAQQAGKLGAAEAWLQPGALGKVGSALTSILSVPTGG